MALPLGASLSGGLSHIKDEMIIINYNTQQIKSDNPQSQLTYIGHKY